jgi:hypothetical protein
MFAKQIIISLQFTTTTTTTTTATATASFLSDNLTGKGIRSICGEEVLPPRLP